MPIPYYVCTMETAFLPPHGRMSFSAYFIVTFLMEFIHQPIIHIKTKTGHIQTRDTVKMRMGSNNLGTMRSSWSRFATNAELKEGDICVFEFKVKKDLPCIKMYVL